MTPEELDKYLDEGRGRRATPQKKKKAVSVKKNVIDISDLIS